MVSYNDKHPRYLYTKKKKKDREHSICHVKGKGPTHLENAKPKLKIPPLMDWRKLVSQALKH